MRAPRRTGAATAAAALTLGAGAAVAAGQSGAGDTLGATPAAAATSGGHARAVAFAVADQGRGIADQEGSGSNAISASSGGAVRGTGRATAVVSSRTARARASARGVTIFGGLVAARSVSTSVRATRGAAPAYDGTVSRLVIAGRLVPSAPGHYSAGGYGTVSVLDAGAGLTVTLTRALHGYPAGSTATVGEVEATAPAKPKPKPKPKPTPAPTHTTTAPTHTATTPAPSDSGGSSRHHTRHHAGSASPAGHGTGHHAAKPAKPATPAKPVPRHAAPAVHAGLTGKGYAFPVYSREASVADNFGAAREIGAHQGDDIFAPFGTPVVAVHDGWIGQVGTLPISGNRLWLHTKSGAGFFYCHLSAFAPTAVNGAHVKAGTVLGFVGNTGDAEPTPPHLHFEIHPTGTEDTGAVDPYPIVTAWQDRQDVPKGSWLTDTAERPGTLVQVRDFLAER